jgi:hypothetical protein
LSFEHFRACFEITCKGFFIAGERSGDVAVHVRSQTVYRTLGMAKLFRRADADERVSHRGAGMTCHTVRICADIQRCSASVIASDLKVHFLS